MLIFIHIYSYLKIFISFSELNILHEVSFLVNVFVHWDSKDNFKQYMILVSL